MCTIGAVYHESGTVLVFKNRDLLKQQENPLPSVAPGAKHHYIGFSVDREDKAAGVWAGVNDSGLAVVGADGNSVYDYHGPEYAGSEITWEAYERVLSECGSVAEAYSFIIEFYSEHRIGGTGDIVILADRERAVAIEYSFNLWSLQFSGNCPYIVRTNFFVHLPHLRPMPESSSLHLSSARRYERALSLLSASSSKTSLADVKAMLCDRQEGPNVFSVCRAGGPGEYKTVASAIFEVSASEIRAHYVMNESPSPEKYQLLRLP